MRLATAAELATLPGTAQRLRRTVGKPETAACRCGQKFDTGEAWDIRLDDATVDGHLFDVRICPACGDAALAANPLIRVGESHLLARQS
jgi:hypothetical protein